MCVGCLGMPPRSTAFIPESMSSGWRPALDLLSALRIFVRVAESGSFTAVAREMGLTQPAISRQIGALEEHLGTRLFHRSTHNLALTEYGRELLGHARAVLETVARAESAVGQQHAGTTGLVRLSADMTFGRVVITPRLHRLLAFYPQLGIDLRLESRPSHMVPEGVDVALPEGEIRDTSLI